MFNVTSYFSPMVGDLSTACSNQGLSLKRTLNPPPPPLAPSERNVYYCINNLMSASLY